MTLASLRQKLLPDGPVLDIHVHPLNCFGSFGVSSPVEDAERLIATARRSGVTRMCVFSLYETTPYEPTFEQCRLANDYVLRMRDVQPDAILPFCYVTPAFPDEAVAEIERCVGTHHMAGVKLWVARRASGPGLDPIMKAAVSLDVPVLQHAWLKTAGNLPGESTPFDVADLARRHPEARIIMAHLNGVGLRGIEAVADVPNVVVDTSGGDPESGMVEAAVSRLGAHRVVYGSDAPIRHFGVTMNKVLGSDIPHIDKRAILWDNALRILKLGN
ncbi:MAG: amidohydrolase family protein [Gemmatimonadetes bacterium]|nr:amidohydrolase family protein [Gemmatimonadota bacterium]